VPDSPDDPTHDLSVEVTEEAGATVAHIRGEVDIVTCERLRDSIEPYLGPRQRVILDLSEVAFMDSSMLHLLVQARGRLTEDGGSLVLRNPSDMARRLLEISEMTGLLEAAGQEPDDR
jgi:stage II sporulation protein AA (anti-sigma F factor antagonist)